ncbi:hypothetical protein DSCA_08640 [Desulfosarcina alkanivorans]|uniref:PilZ domain-containing protein n=1 Tax=Desulfosarcina alkanivorans TaxID=571177 RepID=A0A5K7YKW0_9BACT|nr:PilZ domain-containing protein [Desulfosarcina alkanivorans]BBO66934.1 hypothetical protein DSCA_08640 [Desulfosarcina alkanivorans]
MNTRGGKELIRRIEPRIPTAVPVNCRPFASSHTGRSSHGVMRNFSGGGLYIETCRAVRAGTTLIVRIIHFPCGWTDSLPEHGPRTICLAEVKWQKQLPGGPVPRYGIGLRHW